MLQRDSLPDLVQWCEKDENRKPLLLRGARQVGKTTLIRLLAKQLGYQLVELNMEKAWRFTMTLGDLDPRQTIEAIEFELNIDIDASRSIIFFDEVQACPKILPLLRYFYEETPEYRVVATGSLLEFVLAEPVFSMPVGRLELYHLGPLTFAEFLSALDENQALARIEAFSLDETIPPPVHLKLNHLVRLFSIVGGMPEAVYHFARHRSFRGVEKIKSEIIETFRLDFNKYQGRANPQLLTTVFDAMPRLVGRKLIYSHLDPHRRSDELARAVAQLCLAGVAVKVFHSHANGVPLAAEKNERFFKMMLLDTGLLLTRLGLQPPEVDRADELNLVNNGTLAEQFIGQQLYQLQPVYRPPELYCWARQKKSSSAEVDFVIPDSSGRIVPIEVRTGASGRLRSLQIMVREKSLPRAVRFCSAPPTLVDETRATARGPVSFALISLPHYLVQQLPRLLS